MFSILTLADLSDQETHILSSKIVCIHGKCLIRSIYYGSFVRAYLKRRLRLAILHIHCELKSSSFLENEKNMKKV